VLDEDGLHLRIAVQRLGHGLRRDGLAPSSGQGVDGHAVGPPQVGPALAESAGDQRQHRVARREGVDEGRFHRPRPGAREDQHLVAGLEELLEAEAALAKDLAELVRPVVDDGPRGRFLHRGMKRSRARREEALLADRHVRRVIATNYIGTLKSCPQKLWKSLWKVCAAAGLSLVRLVASSVLHSVTAA
jgi:hypothetical protein